VGLESATFSKALRSCLPFPTNNLYMKRMMWNENPLHRDFVARLVNETHGTHEYWVGLDWNSGINYSGINWTTR
jgi:hypothetical protein